MSNENVVEFDENVEVQTENDNTVIDENVHAATEDTMSKDVEEKATKTKKSKGKSSDRKIKELEAANDELTAKCQENYNLYLSARAEFENFKRRTNEEKLNIFGDATIKCIEALLPVIDNFERAMSLEVDDAAKGYADGIMMIYKQMMDTLKNMGVEEIDAFEKPFDPNFHNGIMMAEDDRFEEQTVIEVFQKGYLYKGKVIRPSMVKVSN